MLDIIGIECLVRFGIVFVRKYVNDFVEVNYCGEFEFFVELI